AVEPRALLCREDRDRLAAGRANVVLDGGSEIGDLLDRRRQPVEWIVGLAVPALDPDRLRSQAQIDRLPGRPIDGADPAPIAGIEANDGRAARPTLDDATEEVRRADEVGDERGRRSLVELL